MQGVTTKLKTARQWKDMLISIPSCTWDPRTGPVWSKGLHSISGRFPHLLPAALPVCHPGLSIYQMARHPQLPKGRGEYLKKHEYSKAVTLTCTLHTNTKPLSPILEHTTHPAPAVASHPHASPGLRDLWTPHTSVSANICSLSLHTPLAKACQDVSTGTYSSQQCVQF